MQGASVQRASAAQRWCWGETSKCSEDDMSAMHEAREKRRCDLETCAEGGQESSAGAGRTSFTRRQTAPVEQCGVASNNQQWPLALAVTLCRNRSLEKASWRLGPALASRQPGRSWALVNRSCGRQATR